MFVSTRQIRALKQMKIAFLFPILLQTRKDLLKTLPVVAGFFIPFLGYAVPFAAWVLLQLKHWLIGLTWLKETAKRPFCWWQFLKYCGMLYGKRKWYDSLHGQIRTGCIRMPKLKVVQVTNDLFSLYLLMRSDLPLLWPGFHSQNLPAVICLSLLTLFIALVCSSLGFLIIPFC